MKIYIEASEIARIAADPTLPTVLKQRQIMQIEADAAAIGIKFVGNSPGIVHADVSASTEKALFAYLSSIGVKAIDLEPDDLRAFSQGVESYSFAKKFKVKAKNIAQAEALDSLRASLVGIPLDEMHDTVDRLLWSEVASGAPENLTASGEEAIAAELRAAGFDVPGSFREVAPAKEFDTQVDMTNWKADLKPRPFWNPGENDTA